MLRFTKYPVLSLATCLAVLLSWALTHNSAYAQGTGTGATYEVLFNIKSKDQQYPAEVGLRCKFFYKKPDAKGRTFTTKTKSVPTVGGTGVRLTGVKMSIFSEQEVDRYRCNVEHVGITKVVNGKTKRDLWPDSRPFDQAFDSNSVLVREGKF